MRNVLLDFKGEIQSLDLKSHTEIFFALLSLAMRPLQGQLGEESCPGVIRRVAASWVEGGGAAVGRKMTT